MDAPISPSERKQLADEFGLSEQYLWQCLAGKRDMNPTKARQLEIDSAGRLRRQDLCQKTWAGIWPELADSTPKRTKRTTTQKGA